MPAAEPAVLPGGAAPPTPGSLNLYDAIAANRRRTVFLMVGFVVIVAALGFVIGELLGRGAGPAATAIALVAAAAWAAGSYFMGDRALLGISGAHEVSEAENLELHHVVEALAIGAGVPKPRVYVIEDTAPNAFATGRDPGHASVAVTTGLLQKLDRTELEGVLAHELSHVRNYDIRLMLVVAVLVGVVALLSDAILRTMFWGGGRRRRDGGGSPLDAVLVLVGLVLAILTPIAAQLVRMAVSRQREYLADASGALLTRYPEGLASALRKLAADREPLEVANKATASMYIVNPLKDRPRGFDGLFDTHPPLEERIRRLESM